MFWGNKTPQDSEPDLARTDSSKNDPAASASQASGTEWLAGHLHHLTPEQEEKLQEFKALCAERKYYTPAVEQADGVEAKPASQDDATLLYVASTLDPNIASNGRMKQNDRVLILIICAGDSSELASLTSRAHGLNSKTPKTGAKTTPSRSYMRISAWTHTRPLDGWCVL